MEAATVGGGEMCEWEDEGLLASLDSALLGWRLVVWGGKCCVLRVLPPEPRELGDCRNDKSAPPSPAIGAVVISISGLADQVP